MLISFKNKNLHKFPIEVLNKKDITNLNLEDNQIQEIPDWVKELQNLKVLYLSHNQIKDFSNLCNLVNLEVLHLNGCRKSL